MGFAQLSRARHRRRKKEEGRRKKEEEASTEFILSEAEGLSAPLR